MRTEPTQQIDRRARPTTRPLLAMIGVLAMAVAPISAGAAPAPRDPTYDSAATNCRVVDGDTLHCDGGRIRLLGIDAPELPGHCAQGRDCAPGDPYESSRSLGAAMGDGASLSIAIVGTDRYGRTLAMVKGAKGDLSCWQLEHGQAIYKPRWDNGRLVASACPNDAH
jgi:endonuclease YncB( thermonuclease family)